MIVALETLAAVVVALVLVGVALRVRKLRRDDVRALSKPADRRLVSPPPSPYTTSRGFRVVDAEGERLHRAPVARPRLDPERHYVFNELTGAHDEVVASPLRHNDEWFLSRSAHRSTLSTVLRTLMILVIVAVVVVTLVTYFVDHRDAKGAHHDRSKVTTTTTVPSALYPSSTSGDESIYRVPYATYRVTVTASTGATLAAFTEGPSNALEWHGTIASGERESLVLTGDARVTLDSPANATVTLEGHRVVDPTTLPPTLAMVFRPIAG